MKKELEVKINELEKHLNLLELNTKAAKNDLEKANKNLRDIDKPYITESVVKQIREAVYEATRQIGFDSIDSYDVDFELDYNNNLSLGNIEFNQIEEVNEIICDYIEDLFNVTSNNHEN
jgi:hypothetical protein